MQLVIDCVPYDCERVDARTLVLHSEFYANLLVVKSRFTEKYAGFGYWLNENEVQFVYVDVDVSAGTVKFSSRLGLELEVVEAWWGKHLCAVHELGYEVLEREPK